MFLSEHKAAGKLMQFLSYTNCIDKSVQPTSKKNIIATKSIEVLSHIHILDSCKD